MSRVKPPKAQAEYYEKTAAFYDEMHGQDLEHEYALAWLSSLIGINNYQSVLDIGAGTGRVSHYLKDRHDVNMIGVEPSEALREKGHETGLNVSELVDGNALDLDFPDNSFDIVCEFAVLHHIEDHKQAVSEMCRVAKKGVFISDSNNFGQGNFVKRSVKQFINSVGLWKAYDLLATKGKGYHFSEGDGLYYSYSVFNDVPILKSSFPNLRYLSTQPSGKNLYRSAPHLAIFASKP